MASQMASLTVADEDSDDSIDQAITAYHGPAAPPISTSQITAQSGRKRAYVVTNGRRLGVFISW